jgi:hypothetical protein
VDTHPSVWSLDLKKPLAGASYFSIFTNFWSYIDPASKVQLSGNEPYMQTYLISACNSIAQEETLGEVQDRFVSLLTPPILNDYPQLKSADLKTRRAWVTKQENREKIVFHPQVPYGNASLGS